MSVGTHWLAIDVGNSAVKMGLFPSAGTSSLEFLPSAHLLRLDRHSLDWNALTTWWPARPDVAIMATVCPAVSDELMRWWAGAMVGVPLVVLSNADVPIGVRVAQPERVGTDRLMAAVAAARLKPADQTALVIDAGSAVTVDLVDVNGDFLGGAILPGRRLLAQSLAQGTAQLPLVDGSEAGRSGEWDLPVVGRSTQEAIRSGIQWGLVGAVRELIGRMAQEAKTEPHLFFTGGDGPWLAEKLALPARIDPPLVLRGILWTGQARLEKSRGAEVT